MCSVQSSPVTIERETGLTLTESRSSKNLTHNAHKRGVGVMISIINLANGIFVEEVKAAAAPAPRADEEDFFDSWSKSSIPNPLASSTPQVTPPVIGCSPSATAPAMPQTVTSSSLRSASPLLVQAELERPRASWMHHGLPRARQPP